MATPNPKGTRVLAVALPLLDPPFATRIEERPFDLTTQAGKDQSKKDGEEMLASQLNLQRMLNTLPGPAHYDVHVVSVFVEWAPRTPQP